MITATAMMRQYNRSRISPASLVFENNSEAALRNLLRPHGPRLGSRRIEEKPVAILGGFALSPLELISYTAALCVDGRNLAGLWILDDKDAQLGQSLFGWIDDAERNEVVSSGGDVECLLVVAVKKVRDEKNHRLALVDTPPQIPKPDQYLSRRRWDRTARSRR